jgi:hypothetical protein
MRELTYQNCGGNITPIEVCVWHAPIPCKPLIMGTDKGLKLQVVSEGRADDSYSFRILGSTDIWEILMKYRMAKLRMF